MAVKERAVDKLFACRLPLEIHVWLEQEARAQRRTKTEILRYLLFTQMQAQGWGVSEGAARGKEGSGDE